MMEEEIYVYIFSALKRGGYMKKGEREYYLK